MTNEFKIKASGRSVQQVREDLDSKRKDLTSKLKKGEKAVNLSPIKTLFFGDYHLKRDIPKDKVDLTGFTIESSESLEDIENKAKRHANFGLYEGMFRAEEYFNLSDEQLKSLKKPSTPLYVSEKTSSIEKDFKDLY